MKGIQRLMLVCMALCMLMSAVPAMADGAAFSEAPMLAEKVKAGELPAVEDRLPVASDVMIETMVDSVGQYGGSICITTNDSGRWTWGPYVEQSLFRFKQDGSGEVEPNICKAFYANEDYTVWTIELREGARWSDGEPLTADDFIFYYDHMSTPALNADRTMKASTEPDYYNAFTSKPYNCYQTQIDGVAHWAVFTKIDDYKYTVTFESPKASFPVDVAVDNKWSVLPKHFYKNYVARKDGVTDDPTFPLITEEQALANANRDFAPNNWTGYSNMGKSIGYYNWDYAIVPQLRSFIATQDNWNKVGEVYELVRNPYFFKVDEEGKQLPYADSIKVYIINEEDQAALLAQSGKLDYYGIPDAKYSTIASSTKDTHTIFNFNSGYWSYGYITSFDLNLTAKDLDKRALFENVEFRHALSIAVDRDLMSETLTNGRAEPSQAAVKKGNYGYDEEWSNKWTEYDPDLANEILDTLTEPWDRKEGTFRTMKGTDKELEIIFLISDLGQEGDSFTLIQSAFRKIGVKLSEKLDSNKSMTILANDHEACFSVVNGSTPAIRPDEMVPMRNYRACFGAYGKWYQDGKSTENGGIEPTGAVRELIDAYDTMKAASGADRDKIVEECCQTIFRLHKENTWCIGYLADTGIRMLVNSTLRNVPETIINVDEFRFSGLVHFEQVYFVK